MWRYAAGAGVVVPIALLVLSEKVLRPDDEILYRGMFSSVCVPARSGEVCYTRYVVSVANNGRSARDDVRVEIGKPLTGWVVGTRFSDLVASNVKRPDPEVSGTDGEQQPFHIRRFAPNTVVDFEIECTRCPREEIRALREAPLRVHARGSVVHTDPRETMLWRAWRNLARVLWIFG